MKKVVIDAGHGGLDSGAVNNLICEKDKVLLFAIELARIFKVIGILPILTRTEDKAITLNARIAQEIVSDADCCISCHMDAGPPNACGMTIWLHSNAPQHYIGWAQDVLDELKKIGFTSNRSLEINKGYRGDDKTDYAWNRGTRSPSMLLELGF
ncbi:MAG: N-acetylmuramoyl-L-alanine amidase, partial [Oscillospiraceae bacterium]